MVWFTFIIRRRVTTIILSAILLAACGTAAPIPTVVSTINPTSDISISTFALASPSLTPPPPIKLPLIITPTTTAGIRLYHNQIASRTVRDRYSFSVVIDKATDFVPKSIQVVEQGTMRLIGQYDLFSENEIQSLCASLMQNPDFVFYETALIDYAELPKGFVARTYESNFIFRITVEYSSGTRQVIELSTPLDACYSAGQ